MSQVFTYFIMIVDDIGERYFIQTVINEKSNTIAMQLTNLKTSWIGTLDENQIRNLAQKFPSETNDSFYSHTQRAFSQNNNNKSSKYTYSLKKIDKNRIEFIWKEKVDDLNILKTIGSIQLEERPNAEILEKLMNRTIEEIDTLQTVNQQKNEDIQRLNTQLTKALETIERTVDLKEKLEADLYKKFVLVLNTKKTELAKLRNQTDGRPLFEDDQQVVSNKRTRDEDTTDEDEKNESQPEPKIFHHRQDSSSLELGNDGMDYKTSTIPKHHQRRKKPTTEIDPIRTRSFVRHTSNASVMPLPSLPDDSQTTDDILKINMSEGSDTYTCDKCTYVQSINVLKCEMCEAENTHRTKTIKKDDANSSDQSIECPKCSFVNYGDFIRVCEMCEHSFGNDSSKRLHSDDEVDNDDDDDDDDEYFDYDGDDSFGITLPQNKDKKRKPIEAVEKPMNDEELKSYFEKYLAVLKDQHQQTKNMTEEELHKIIIELFQTLQYQNDQAEGELVFRACQICFDKNEPMITMKACGHRMICIDDFHQYITTRIRDGDILPWIPCPAEICSVPCSAENLVQDGRLNHGQLLSFITTYMSKKLARNENFITCIQCQQGGFLQFGTPKKQEVICPICSTKQTIEKGSDGDLDIAFKQMIQSGQLRECPTCRHLTLKEKGLCNVIECAKCSIWWNWRTKEQGHNGKDLKQRARMNGTLWEPGELQYQQDLERRNPKEFKALLERNGITYNPNYVRGGWNGE